MKGVQNVNMNIESKFCINKKAYSVDKSKSHLNIEEITIVGIRLYSHEICYDVTSEYGRRFLISEKELTSKEELIKIINTWMDNLK